MTLRGSLVLDALCPGARPPQDVDYLVPGAFDEAACEAAARAIASRPDGQTTLGIERTEVIFGDTAFPGVRAHVVGEASGVADHFQVDFAFGDPLPAPARPIAIAGIGPVLACTAETLYGWKLHGLVEYGRGRWRPKDLFDLWLLGARVPLDRAALRAAVELAFSSRGLPLNALDDFRTREGWGLSASSGRKWRAFARRTPGAPDALEARGAVRALVDELLGPAPAR